MRHRYSARNIAHNPKATCPVRVDGKIVDLGCLCLACKPYGTWHAPLIRNIRRGVGGVRAGVAYLDSVRRFQARMARASVGND